MGAGKIPTLLKIENLFFLVTLAVMISILTECIHVLESSLLVLRSLSSCQQYIHFIFCVNKYSTLLNVNINITIFNKIIFRLFGRQLQYSQTDIISDM